MSRLTFSGEISDATGMASAILASEVGYPGSSIAFAQLLSGMQRSGLIEREVRGKRTYRIAAVPGAAARVAAAAQVRGDHPVAITGLGPALAGQPLAGPVSLGAVSPGATPAREAMPPAWAAAADGAGPAGAAGASDGGGLTPGPELAREPGLEAGADAAAGDFDYDELARRLLVQVVRRLASASEEAQPGPGGAGADLEQTVAGLRRELATVRTMHGTLSAENARLREQLSAARRHLALAQDRAAGSRSVGGQLDAAEAGLLERLLVSARDEIRPADAETG